MGNLDKRKKRAKDKAKKARLAKQRDNSIELVSVNEDLIIYCSSFQDIDSIYEMVPHIRDFTSSLPGSDNLRDFEASVSVFFAMYVLFLRTGSMEINSKTLVSLGDQFLSDPNFISHFNGEVLPA